MSDFFTTFVDLDWLYSVEFVSNTINEKFKWFKKWIRSEPDDQVLIWTGSGLGPDNGSSPWIVKNST